MKCKLRNASIHYEVRGEGRPVLLIHGYSPDHRIMEGCMEPVFQETSGWKRLYFDLPGMGRTGAPEWLRNSDQMLDTVFEFAESVIGERSFAVVGESYGGYLARGMVRRRPELVAGVALIAPGVHLDPAKRDRPSRVVLVHDERLMADLDDDDREAFGELAVVQNRGNWERFRDEILPGLQLADWAFLKRLQEEGYSFSFDPDALPQPFERPALIIAGRQDAVVGYRDAFGIIENYPRATFAVLDMAGHNVQIEQAALFSALVKEWLERLTA